MAAAEVVLALFVGIPATAYAAAVAWVRTGTVTTEPLLILALLLALLEIAKV